jgi:hypothetical protein
MINESLKKSGRKFFKILELNEIKTQHMRSYTAKEVLRGKFIAAFKNQSKFK